MMETKIGNISTLCACACLLLIATACGDEDPTPKELCRETYDTLCGKFAACKLSSSDVSDCWSASDVVCGKINAVVSGKSPAACNSDLDGMSCSKVQSSFTLPSSCYGLYTSGGSSGGGSTCNCSSVVKNCSITYDSFGNPTKHCTCTPSCCC